MEWWSALKKQRWSQQKLIWCKFFELRCHWITFSPTSPKLTSKSATDVTFTDPVKVTSAECRVLSPKLLYSRKGYPVFYETDNYTFSAKVAWTCDLSIGQQGGTCVEISGKMVLSSLDLGKHFPDRFVGSITSSKSYWAQHIQQVGLLLLNPLKSQSESVKWLPVQGFAFCFCHSPSSPSLISLSSLFSDEQSFHNFIHLPPFQLPRENYK